MRFPESNVPQVENQEVPQFNPLTHMTFQQGDNQLEQIEGEVVGLQDKQLPSMQVTSLNVPETQQSEL